MVNLIKCECTICDFTCQEQDKLTDHILANHRLEECAAVIETVESES